MEKKQLILVIACILGVCLTSLSAQNSPYVPAGYVKTFADEFDGTTVNTSNWTFRLDSRWDGINLEKNVRLGGGKLYIDFLYEPRGTTTYSGGGIITKRNLGYGYYEVSSKTFGATGGLHSSFWTMGVNGNGIDAPRYNQVIEIDGYEVNSLPPCTPYSCVHYYIGSHTSLGGAGSTLVNMSSQYVTSAFEYTPTYIKYYINGTLTRTLTGLKYIAAQNFWLTALGGTHFEAVDNTKLPGYSEWEYFRYYAKEMSGYNWISNYDFEYNKAPNQVNVQYPVSWIEIGNADASLVDTFATAYTSKCKLIHFSTTDYTVQTIQKLDYIPNGTYTMKAWVRSSGGQRVAQLFATQCGASSFAVNIPQLDTWTQITLSNIKVENNSCILGLNSVAAAYQWLEMDNVEFIQTAKAGLDTPVSSNLIKDSSFDLNFSNTYNPSTIELGWSSITNFNTGEFVSSKVSETNGNNFYRCTTSIAKDDFNHALAQFTSKEIAPGKYKLTFRSKADAGDFYLKLSTKNAVSTFLPTNLSEASNGITLIANKLYIAPTTEWQNYSCVFDLNFLITDYLRVFFQFPNKGTYDIDDVQLIPIATTAINEVESKFNIFGRNGTICISGDVHCGMLEIYSITGELIRQINVNDCKNYSFAKGVYIVKLTNDKSVLKVSKVIIQ
jgi:hypothetical protein